MEFSIAFFLWTRNQLTNLNKASSPTLGRIRPFDSCGKVNDTSCPISSRATGKAKPRTSQLPKLSMEIPLLPSSNYPWNKLLETRLKKAPSTFHLLFGSTACSGVAVISWLFIHCGNDASVLFVLCKLHLYLIFPEMPRSNLLTMTRIPCRRRYSQKSKALQQWKECARTDWRRTNDFK